MRKQIILADTDDWQLTLQFFQFLDRPHIDCFVNFYNTKLPRFFTRYWNPGGLDIEFFVQNLQSENCLVVPPVGLIAKTLHYLSVQGAYATVVVPFWPSASFWPLITHRYRQFIKGRIQQDGATGLMLGTKLNSLSRSKRFKDGVADIRFEFA